MYLYIYPTYKGRGATGGSSFLSFPYLIEGKEIGTGVSLVLVSSLGENVRAAEVNVILECWSFDKSMR